MWKTLKIDFVAPPFGGHLYPLLELARFLRDHGMANLRVVSTHDAAPAVALSGLDGVYLLPGEEARIWAIANPPHRVKSNPLRLFQQFSANLSLMGAFKTQLEALWQARPPDLVIADFTLPVAGFVAQEMGARWWSSTPAVCAIETKTGTPSYLGGWTPGQSLPVRARDFIGRKLIRGFKRGVGWWFREAFRVLNIPGVYRENGDEQVYSPDKILGFAIREFEFERDWPAALTFIGPLTASPPFPHSPPTFQNGARHVLVSLGTHLPWAKDRAARFVERVAAQMPDVRFHFSYGRAGDPKQRTAGNVAYYGYFPYDSYMHHYDAAIIHGGTGVLYSCLRAAVPMLVWPHDYDHFDNAARIVQRGLGLRFKPDVRHTAQRLRRLFSDEHIARRMQLFQTHLKAYTPTATVLDFIRQLGQGGDQDNPI